MNVLNYMSEKAVNGGRFIALAGRSLYRDGPRGMFNKIVHRRRYWAAQRKIDAEYGTETLSMLAIDDFSAISPNISHAYEYHPTPAFEFDAILRQLPIPYSEYVFADLGCGKGLALILASRFGFKRIIGVEFEKNLHEVALTNLHKFRQHKVTASPIDVILGDAAEFPFPTEPLVVYLYNPFGPEIIRLVLANLRASLSEHPRNCWIVYVRPLHHELLASCDFLTTHTVLTDRDLGEPYALYTHSPAQNCST